MCESDDQGTSDDQITFTISVIDDITDFTDITDTDRKFGDCKWIVIVAYINM